MAFDPSSFSSFSGLSGQSNADRHAKALELAQGWASSGINQMRQSGDQMNAMAFGLGKQIIGQQEQEKMMQQQMEFERQQAKDQASAQQQKSGMGFLGGVLGTAASFIPGAGSILSKVIPTAFSAFG